jgi:hypothetical protein
MTPYHYSHNNPINRFDPDGRKDSGVISSVMRVEYNKFKYNAGRFINYTMYKYTPKALEVISKITGFAGYKIPHLKVISLAAQGATISWKINNPYYSVPDIYGDVVGGLVVSLFDPIAGVIVDKTLESILSAEENNNNQEEGANKQEDEKGSESIFTTTPKFKEWVTQDVWQDKDGNFHLRYGD